jgi:multidrug resistance efflux pump
MDIVSKHKTDEKLINYKVWGGMAVLIAIVAYAATQFETDTIVVDRDSIITGEALRSDLQVLVRGNGVLVPRDNRWISGKVSGIVGSVEVKPGHQVKEGDLLLRLTNPQLERALEQKNWELKALQAELTAKEQELASQLLSQKAILANAEFQFLSAQLKQNAIQKLLNQGLSSLSKLDYESSKLLVSQLKTIWDIEKQRLALLESTIAARMFAEQAKVEQLQKNRQNMIEQIESLKIYASFDAEVQELSLLVGTQVQTGDRLVKLAQTNELIAELTVPEAQTRDIKIGQPVTLTTRVNSKIQGQVSRIASAIVDGNVRLDVDITGELPQH